ncbi:phage major capsid protein, HK97 family [Saccharopolyspora shandongensis]|uniref:Phage major capsid protein, HK97 family n=1 Tax=Saccharopolyspora shandongensis TaxID=418495 RepID=A0A1H3TYQ9_9PSEU|nr:phage major capsid protein [Saccharopolyspora shandongensis]SDZ55222.1 phage major capsid protein, HK97 family [Saccharopolyspora shandongensis]
MEFPALKEAEDRLSAKQSELAKIFAEAGDDLNMDNVKSLGGDTAAKVDHIRKLNAELDELGQKAADLQMVAKAAERARQVPEQRESGAETGGERKGRPAELKSLGELFTDSVAYKGKQGSSGPEAHLDIELKTLFQTTAGWAPETTRTGRVVDFATRPIQVIDLIPQTTTGQSAVVYMEETTFTNAAAETAEGGAYPEAALALTEQSSPVRKTAVFLPVTDEQLEDEQQAAGYVNNRLPFMLRQRLDSQILVGNGTAPNLRGILNVVGIQTQAKGTDPVPDAIYKALVKTRVAGQAMPNAVVMHPNDWQDVRLLRTADGIYIWGSPSEAGPSRIWGLPVAEAQAITENTALVGDFANFSELSVRRGLDVQVSNSHADYFVNGKQAMRADLRAALVIYRPAAFCTVTGI